MTKCKALYSSLAWHCYCILILLYSGENEKFEKDGISMMKLTVFHYNAFAFFRVPIETVAFIISSIRICVTCVTKQNQTGKFSIPIMIFRKSSIFFVCFLSRSCCNLLFHIDSNNIFLKARMYGASGYMFYKL